MPEDIIRRFKKEYGAKKGKSVYYATANAQGRDPETFKLLKRPTRTRAKQKNS